jgi:hypothetical protein
VAQDGTFNNTLAGVSQGTLTGSNSYSQSSSGTSTANTGSAPFGGSSTYANSGTDTIGSGGSYTDSGSSSGTAHADSTATQHVAHSANVSFSGADTLSIDETAVDTLVLWEVGSAGLGGFSLTSYTRDEQGSDTFTQSEQQSASVSGTSQDTITLQQASNANASSNGSGSSSGTGFDGFLGANGSASSSGSSAGTMTATDSETLLQSAGFTQTDSAVETAIGSDTFHLFQAGLYSNGSLALGSVGLDETAGSSDSLSAVSTQTSNGCFSEARSGSGLGSYTDSNLGTLGQGTALTFGMGGTGNGCLSANGSASSGSNGSYQYSTFRSANFSDSQTDTENDSATETVVTHEAGSWAGGLLSLGSLTQGDQGSDSTNATQTGTSQQSAGTASALVSQHSAGTFNSAGSATGCLQMVGALGVGGTQSSSGSAAGTFSSDSTDSYGYAFTANDTFSASEGDLLTWNNYEGGIYGNGSLSLGSLSVVQGSQDTTTSTDTQTQQITGGTDSLTQGAQQSGSGSSTGSGNLGFSAGTLAGLASAASVGLGSSGSLSMQESETASFSGTDTTTVVDSTQDSDHLVEAGSWSAGSLSLVSLVRDSSSGETLSTTQNDTRNDSGSATETLTQGSTASLSAGDTNNYAGAATGNASALASSTASLSVLEGSTFTSTQSETDSQTQSSNATLHEEGTFSGGSLALSSYALGQSEGDNFSVSAQGNDAFTGSTQNSRSAAGNDTFSAGIAGGAITVGGSGPWSWLSGQSYSSAGNESGTLAESGGQTFSEQDYGTFSGNSLSLGCLSYAGSSLDSTSAHDGQTRTPTMLGSSGGETATDDSSAVDSVQYSGAGNYSGGRLTLASFNFDETQSAAETVQGTGNPVWATGGDSYTQEQDSSDGLTLHEVGGYGSGGLSLSCYAYSEQTKDHGSSAGCATQSSSADQSQDTWNDSSNDSATLAESGTYGGGVLTLSSYSQDEGSGISIQEAGAGTHTAGAEVEAWSQGETLTAAETLHEAGSFSSAGLSLSSYTSSAVQDDSQQAQDKVTDPSGVRTWAAADTSHEDSTGSGAGQFVTLSSNASDNANQSENITAPAGGGAPPTAFTTGNDNTTSSGTRTESPGAVQPTAVVGWTPPQTNGVGGPEADGESATATGANAAAQASSVVSPNGMVLGIRQGVLDRLGAKEQAALRAWWGTLTPEQARQANAQLRQAARIGANVDGLPTKGGLLLPRGEMASEEMQAQELDKLAGGAIATMLDPRAADRAAAFQAELTAKQEGFSQKRALDQVRARLDEQQRVQQELARQKAQEEANRELGRRIAANLAKEQAKEAQWIKEDNEDRRDRAWQAYEQRYRQQSAQAEKDARQADDRRAQEKAAAHYEQQMRIPRMVSRVLSTFGAPDVVRTVETGNPLYMMPFVSPSVDATEGTLRDLSAYHKRGVGFGQSLVLSLARNTPVASSVVGVVEVVQDRSLAPQDYGQPQEPLDKAKRVGLAALEVAPFVGPGVRVGTQVARSAGGVVVRASGGVARLASSEGRRQVIAAATRSALLRRQAAQAAGRGGCFVGGTPLLTPTGAKAIERFEPGDLVLSRSEHTPEGALEAKVVLDTFVLVAPVLELHVGGRVIRTTAEHAFSVVGRGWLAAGFLQAGDVLCSHDGKLVAVERLVETREVLTVYNLAVEDHHTYFVGCQERGFSVWSHNRDACTEILQEAARRANLPGADHLRSPKLVDAVNEANRTGNWKPVEEILETKWPGPEFSAKRQDMRRHLADLTDDAKALVLPPGGSHSLSQILGGTSRRHTAASTRSATRSRLRTCATAHTGSTQGAVPGPMATTSSRRAGLGTPKRPERF